MPSKSPAQHRLMEAVAHSPAFAKKVGISQSVGKDFAKADEGKKFKKGGGLYANIHAKQERIANGSGEHMRKVGSKGAPTAQAFKDSAKTTKKSGGGVSLSVGRGEKLSTKEGAGLTAKGRAKANRATGSHLQAPAPHPKTKKDEGRKKSFCARMSGVVEHAKGDAPRAKASLARWNCKEGGAAKKHDIKGW
jgi:hypothetical protein